MSAVVQICMLLGLVVSVYSFLLGGESCPKLGTKTDKTNNPLTTVIHSRCCTFPFKYNGKTYNSCTTEGAIFGKGVYWCSLISNAFLDPVNVLKGRCVDGHWSEWSSWSKCKRKRQRRHRNCNSPAPDPELGGRKCVGEPKEKKPCKKIRMNLKHLQPRTRNVAELPKVSLKQTGKSWLM